MNVRYGKIEKPPLTVAKKPIDLTDATMQEHRSKIQKAMKENGYDVLVVYADREHGGNYGYLIGFEPRFEESVLVLHSDEKAYLMLGNESLKMAEHARIPVKAVHVPHFSLPCQPMDTENTFLELLRKTGLRKGQKVGVVGWKLFTGKWEDNRHLFDVPYFIVEGIKNICGDSDMVVNATDLFIHPMYGARIRVNANEIAHYEYASSLASDCIYRVMENIDAGKTELDLADLMSTCGQPLSVQTICATGERFVNAVVEPRDKKVAIGDRVTFTMGLRGGLSHRCGYAVSNKEQMSNEERDYMDNVAIPYYKALTVWYSNVGIGVKAKQIYNEVERIIPKSEFHWLLNPGHYTAGEEWMSSPFYPESEVTLDSGMMLQMDIIINVKGFGGANAEDGIVLADRNIREEIKKNYPDLWERFCRRREYMREVLHIPLKECVLPMSTICGYYRPYMLDKENAFYIN